MESRSRPDQQDLHMQTDSFLTAARLLRGGRLDGGQQRRWQFAHEDTPADSPAVSRSRARTPAEPSTEDSESIGRKTPEDGEPSSDTKAEGEAPVSSLTSVRSRSGVVYSWTSGCRLTYRKSRRFRAPFLPAIAEI